MLGVSDDHDGGSARTGDVIRVLRGRSKRRFSVAPANLVPSLYLMPIATSRVEVVI